MKENRQTDEQQLIETLIESKQKYRMIIQAAIARWVKDFQDGKIVIKTADDLKTLMMIDLELQKNIRTERKMQGRKHVISGEGDQTNGPGARSK